MKIAYVVPGPMKREEVSRRELLLQQWASPGVTVEIIDVAQGPASVESMYEEYLGIPEAAKNIYRLDQEDYAAVVLGCAGDPGLDALREITKNVLIVGPREAGMNMAAMLGHRFSVLTVTDSRIPRGHELAMIAGLRSKLVHVRALNIPVLELAQNRSATLEKAGTDRSRRSRAPSSRLSRSRLHVHGLFECSRGDDESSRDTGHESGQNCSQDGGSAGYVWAASFQKSLCLSTKTIFGESQIAR